MGTPVAHYTISTVVAAPPEHVFALWTNVERMGEWVGGVTGVSDVSGPIDRVGTTYVVHFGPVKSPTEVLEADPPRRFATRFGSWVLRGLSSATFAPEGDGTRVTQEFETKRIAVPKRLDTMGKWQPLGRVKRSAGPPAR